MAADRDEKATAVPARCAALHRSLSECHSRARDPVQREVVCRHLNRSLAECVVSVCCPDESEAVRSMCSSAGTRAKRAQCQGAQLSLSLCLASHQASD